MQPLPLHVGDFESSLIQPAELAPVAVCCSFSSDGTSADLLHAKFDRKELLSRWDSMLRGNVAIGGQNLAYDFGLLAVMEPDLLPTIFEAYERDLIVDTEQAARLLDLGRGILRPGGGYNLGDQVQALFGHTLDKNTWRLRYGELIDVPIPHWEPGAVEYPKEDARWTWRAMQHHHSHRLVELGPGVIHDDLSDLTRQTRASWWLHLMVCWGFKTDPWWVQQLASRLEKERDILVYRLRHAGLIKPDGSRSESAARARMEDINRSKGLDTKMTSGGTTGVQKVSIDDEACTDSGDAILMAYARYSSLNTIWTKDIPAISKPVIQSRFETLMETGRTGCRGSAKKGKESSSDGFQLQNVRREPGVRETFIPREGFVLLSVDYGQMELHSWAQVCIKIVGWSNLANLLNNKIDIHMTLGSKMIGVEYEYAMAHRKEKQFKDARQMGKAGAFGLPGGLGEKTLVIYAKGSWSVVMTLHDAHLLKNFWKEECPEHEPYFAHINSIVGGRKGGTGDVIHIGSNRRRGECYFTVACNSYFQGLAADAAKQAGFYVSKACYVRNVPSLAYGGGVNPLFGSRIVNFVHDELILEVPIATAHEAAMETVAIMETAGRAWMPDCPPRAEPALMARWRKGAEPTYDERGRLTVWTPKSEKEGLLPWEAHQAGAYTQAMTDAFTAAQFAHV